MTRERFWKYFATDATQKATWWQEANVEDINTRGVFSHHFGDSLSYIILSWSDPESPRVKFLARVHCMPKVSAYLLEMSENMLSRLGMWWPLLARVCKICVHAFILPYHDRVIIFSRNVAANDRGPITIFKMCASFNY